MPSRCIVEDQQGYQLTCSSSGNSYPHSSQISEELHWALAEKKLNWCVHAEFTV